MHVEGADSDIIDVSMKNVVHYDPPSQISLSFTKLNATLKDSNHSTQQEEFEAELDTRAPGIFSRKPH